MQLRPPAVLVSPETDGETRSTILNYYSAGDWPYLKTLCEIEIPSFVKELPNSMFRGTTTFKFYYGAIAYKKTGEGDKYRACLKVLFSLNKYYSNMNKIDQELIQNAVEEYNLIAKEYGTEFLNAIDVKEVLKKSSGCFIATAVYGSPYTDEVLVLKEFRDSWLLNYRLGKTFVRFYYWVSPPIANQIAKRKFLKEITKSILIIPLLST